MHKLLPEVPTRLDTKRLIVRKYQEGDGRELFLLLERNGSREFLRENVEEVSSIKTEEEAEIKVRKHSAEWFARERFVMGIWLKSEDKYVGQIWIEPKNWEVSSFEIGWSWIEAIKEKESQLRRFDVHWLFSSMTCMRTR